MTLKKLSPKQRVSYAKSDLRYFARYLGYSQFAPFHDDLYTLLQPCNDSEHFSPLPWQTHAIKNYHLEAPRKHAKSESIINYVSWLIGNYPDIHILIVSKTSDLAEATVAAIKNRIENDERYLTIFGNLKPKTPQKWTDSEFIVERKKISKFPTLRGCGLMGSLTGGGYDLIIADDIIDEENINTKLQLEKVSRWFFKVLLTTLFANGACFVIGTRWHYADLYNELITPKNKGGKGWLHRVYKAILNEKEIEAGQKPVVLWPSQWSYERLLKKREEIGTIYFNCQYQNDPTGLEGDLLKAEWLHHWEDEPSPSLPNFAGVDVSTGDAQSDLYSIATLSYDRHNKQGYLKEVYADRVSFPLFLKTLKQKHDLYHYSKIYIESNAFQKVLMYIEELKGLPIVPSPTTQNKEARFIPMSSHFEAKRVLLNPLIGQTSEFWSEWIQFPKAAHDDALDGAEIVVREVIGNYFEPWVMGVDY